MIDELSQFVSVETLEKAPADGVGETQYYVYVGGQMLVDTYNVNELVVKQKDTVSNINDITGCYDVACKYEKPVIVMEPIKGGSLINVPDDVKKTI